MNPRSLAFTLLVSAMVIAIALGLFVAQSTGTPSPTGEISQSPYIYLVFTLLLFTMGFLLSKVLTGENSKFSFFSFVNVSLAGILISGLAHEFVHVLLINHPVQLRFHFGDSNAIFSTCCLSPGEAPYEGVAYGIQFLILILWLFFNRHSFYHGRFRDVWKKYSDDSSPLGKKANKGKSSKKNSKKNAPTPTSEMDEDDLEKEWRTHKSEMESHLAGKNKPRSKDNSLENEINKIGRLKV